MKRLSPYFILSGNRLTIRIILDGQREQGGASRRAGGRDERPPQISGLNADKASIRRWIPPSSVKRDTNDPESKHDITFRRVRGILNKIAPEKFDKLSLELLNVGIDSKIVLQGIILLIFEKALEEPKYSSLYAQLCNRLCEDAPNFEPPNSGNTTFRRLLLNKCQDEFENRSQATDVYEKKEGPLTPEEEEARNLAKWKMLGNIKFIGELGKLQMLHEGILHRCIKQLLEKKKSTTVYDMSEDLECLCQIMRTIGPRLDTDKAKAWMDQYFERMKAYKYNPELPARIKFMLQDCIELRGNKWQPRIGRNEHNPKTIGEVRVEAAKEFGVFYPPPGAVGAGRGVHLNSMGGMNNFDRMNGPMFPSGPRMGLNDMFGPVPPAFMGTSGIGTGPGVIPMDGGFMAGYSNNMGRVPRMQNNHKGFDPMFNKREGGSTSPRFQHNNQQDEGNPKSFQAPRYNSRDQQNNDQRGGASDRQSYNSDRQPFDNDRQYNDRRSFDNDRQPFNRERPQYDNDRRQQRSQYNNDRFQQQPQQQRGQFPASNQQSAKTLPPRFQKKFQQQAHVSPPPSSQNDVESEDPDFPTPSLNRSNTPPTSIRNNTPPMGAITMDGEISLRPTVGPAQTSAGDVSLRPATKTYTPMFKPGVPSMLPKSTQLHTGMMPSWAAPEPDFAPKPTPLMPKQTPIVVKPAPEKKERKEPPKKENKAPSFSKEDLREKTHTVLQKFLETKDTKEAVSAVKELKVPKRFLPDMVSFMMIYTLHKSDEDRDEVNLFLKALHEKGVVNSTNLMDGLGKLLGQMSQLEEEVPLVRSYASKYAATAVSNGLITLVDLSEPLVNGAHYPLFMLCLQQLRKIRDQNWLTDVFNESKIDLQTMLPECDRNKDRMMEILEDRGLSFMFPLLRVQNELWKQIKKDPNPTSLYKWTKDNVDQKMWTSPGFINVLVSTIVKYITGESTLANGQSALMSKAAQDKEAALLDSFKGILQKFLHDKPDLQLVAIYALQVHCYNNSFPKGMLLRMFMKLYDHEIIEEETFLKWKEEVNDEFPGKGKALFQVNQWLTWLEQAEEESEDENDDA